MLLTLAMSSSVTVPPMTLDPLIGQTMSYVMPTKAAGLKEIGKMFHVRVTGMTGRTLSVQFEKEMN